ncbi:hypothetical protein FJO69_02840 [[Mycoplasma] falconis]|uniref:Uncharacterized protein n=1 Tax=[Mycoplasma] falconis TaxID=92403 RepID=A0A501X840_9BACT|nr:hypothetical protein [[Mycoplasma] falconis]TPE56569.1 hypothetical protein FJO69_02840 [[Mycoplasma] falconis]
MNFKALFDEANVADDKNIGGNKQDYSGMGQIVVYVILGVLFAVVIGYIIFKITKAKLAKKKAFKQEKKKAEENLTSYYEYIMTIDAIIKKTLKELEEFNVIVGKVKMSQIKRGAKKLIYKLMSREDFIHSFVNNPQYKTFIDNIEVLYALDANQWMAKRPELIEYFERQYSRVPRGERFNELTPLINKAVEEKFYEETKTK